MLMYDEDTLKWLRDRSNANILRLYQDNLKDLSKGSRDELLDEGLIVRNLRDNRLRAHKSSFHLAQYEWFKDTAN